MSDVKKIPGSQYDSLRDFILGTEGKEVEMIVYGRRGERPICVDLVGSPGISRLTADALAEAVERHFEGQSERVRLRTQFSLVAYPEISGIFLEYRMEDHLLGLERATLEVPDQLMRLVRFLEEEPKATVEFRYGYDSDEPFETIEFVMTREVDMAGCTIVSFCAQNARPSFGFMQRVVGEYLERIVLNSPPIMYGSPYIVTFVLEEENGVVYFRMKHKGQQFYSIEKDKLRSKK